MGSIPNTLREFKTKFVKNLSDNVDSADYSKSSHLKIQLVESNKFEIPKIDGYSPWKPFEDTIHWYCCSRESDFIVVNKYSDRVWAIFSLMRVDAFNKTIKKWIHDSFDLDKCWIPSSRIKKIGISNEWVERGVGLRYHDLSSDENSQSKFSMKAWYGSNEVITDAIEELKNNFAVSSYRFKNDSTSSVSEWYSDGRITFNSSDDSEIVIESVNQVMKYYDDELSRVTSLRDEHRGSFEFRFKQKINLNGYSNLVSGGKSELQLWMVEVESLPDFRRYRGVDMHTWDRIFLDLGDDYAYMTIPGKGCVNAAPRLISIQGETLLGKTNVYYNGDEIFE